MNEDRIKLSEAMGWKPVQWMGQTQYYPPGLPPEANVLSYGLPNPFINANDDYAVLKWMREKSGKELDYFYLAFDAGQYEIGDYARAALAVLKENDE